MSNTIDRKPLFAMLTQRKAQKKGVMSYLLEHFDYDDAYELKNEFDSFIMGAKLPKTDNIKFSDKNSTASLECKGKIGTVEELIKVAKIDTKVWDIVSSTVNKLDVQKDRLDPLIHIRVGLKKKKSEPTTDLVAWAKEQFAKADKPKHWNVKPVKSGKGKHLLELAIPDLHIGKLCWSEETSAANYDSKIAVAVFKQAVEDLISKVPMDSVDRILLPVGNDFFNTDGADEATTAGTPQMEDSRWQNTFKKGCDLLVEVISKLAATKPVDVVLVQGNHDTERSFYLGEYISGWFHNHPNVTVNNEPTQRKYYSFGKNLIGFTHGDKEKHDTLGQVMATEQPLNWGKSTYKEWHLGHLHKETDMEIMGVKIRILPSLVSTDAWHASKAYIGNTRTAKAFLYHVDKGLEAQYYFNI